MSLEESGNGSFELGEVLVDHETKKKYVVLCSHVTRDDQTGVSAETNFVVEVDPDTLVFLREKPLYSDDEDDEVDEDTLRSRRLLVSAYYPHDEVAGMYYLGGKPLVYRLESTGEIVDLVVARRDAK